MTDRFKIALNNIKSLEGRTFSSPDECDTIYAGKLVSYMDEIIEALTIATEAEQLRKERDDVMEDKRKLADALVFLQSTLKFDHPVMELAKKVNENGNA